jgi:hypothetical protein
MRILILLLLCPILGLCQKVSVTPFHLSPNEKIICFAITIENTSNENIYIFQKGFDFKLIMLENGKKKKLLPDNSINRGGGNYQVRLSRNKSNKQYESLFNHLIALKDKYVIKEIEGDSCNVKKSNSDYVLQWYSNFSEDILFIPTKGKISLLSDSFTIDSKLDRKYTFVIDYNALSSEKFKLELLNICTNKMNAWWYIPSKYEKFVRMKTNFRWEQNITF